MGLGWPPLTFTPYGLAGEWDAPRWLDMLDGRLGHPATGVQLRHGWTRGRDPERPWLRITSLRKDRYDELTIDRVAVPADGADHAMFALTDVTMPAPLVSPDDYRGPDLRAGQAPSTSTRRVAADDVDHRRRGRACLGVPVRRAWAGFTTAGTAADVIVLGFGIEPDGLALTELHDTSAYHVDAPQPLSLTETLPRSQKAALEHLRGDGGRDVDRPWPAHPDHASVLW